MKLAKKLTTATPLSKILAMVLFIALPFVGFYLGIRYQGLNNTIKNVPQIQTQITQKQVENVVSQFEAYQEARDGKKVMSIFTPPDNDAEKKDYEFILGLDYGGELPRLFTTAGLGYHVISYQINSIIQLEKIINVEVEESREDWSNVTGKYGEPYASNRIIQLVNNDNKLLIEKYYPGGNSGKTGKYDGILFRE